MGTLDTMKGVLDSYPALQRSELERQKEEIDNQTHQYFARLTSVEQELGTKANQSDLTKLTVRAAEDLEKARAEVKPEGECVTFPCQPRLCLMWPWWVWVVIGVVILGLVPFALLRKQSPVYKLRCRIRQPT